MGNIQDLIQFLACILFLIRNLKSEIPNITGVAGASIVSANHGTSTGALGYNVIYNLNAAGVSTATPNCGRVAIKLDASSSSNRYGDYTEVNPLYNSTLMLIKF